MTDFLRLKIEIYAYRRIAERAEFFASVGECIDDAVTGQRGDGDWFGEVQDFFDDVRSIWKTMEEREAEGAVKLNYDSPDHFLERIESKTIETMGLVEVLTLLRKATATTPEIDEYSWTCPGNGERKPDPERDQRFITAFRNGLIAPALQRLNKLMEFSPAEVEAVLELKPIFDSLTVEQFRTWNGWEPMELEDGGQALHVPYPDYHPVVSQWFELLYQTPFYIDPYREVPGKEGGVPPPRFMGLGEPGRPTPEEFFAEADLDEVRQYMSLCLRGEKWCDGFIAGEFERGVIQAAFARLSRLACGHNGQATTFGDCVDFTTKPRNLKLLTHEVPFVAMDLVPSGRLDFSDFEMRATSRITSGVFLEERDGVIARITPCFENGKQGFISHLPGGFGFGSTELIAFKGKPGIADTRYLLYVLATPTIRAELAGKMEGTTGRQRLSKGTLADWEFHLASYEDQLRSVELLDAIQAARLARLREIELERERKAALMAHLFAYGTQNDPRRDTPLGPLPESWEVVPMGKVCKFLSGGTPSKSRPDFWQGTIPWVSGKDLKHPRLNDVIDHVSEEGASVGSKMAPAHSILILVRGMGLAKDIPMSQIARPMAFNQDLKAICPPDEATGDYLYWALQQVKPDFERHIGMAAHGTRKIAGSVLDNLLIPLPEVEERKTVADALWAAHACGIALEAEAKLLDELFRATLEELMSGRLSVALLRQEVVA